MTILSLAAPVLAEASTRVRRRWFGVPVVVVVLLAAAWAVGRAEFTPRFQGGDVLLSGPAVVGVPYTDADGFVLTRLPLDTHITSMSVPNLPAGVHVTFVGLDDNFVGGVVNGFQVGDPRWHRSSHVVPLGSLRLSTDREKPARYGEIITVDAPGTYVIGFPVLHWRSGVWSGSAQGTSAITLTATTGTPDYANDFLGYPPR